MAIIMVVDEEPDACRLLERLLSASGHTVHAFTMVRDALGWLAGNTPDLALLDISQPGGEGVGVLEGIRRRGLPTKAVMITGRPTAESASRAFELGVEDCLVKPIDIDELEARINESLGLAR